MDDEHKVKKGRNGLTISHPKSDMTFLERNMTRRDLMPQAGFPGLLFAVPRADRALVSFAPSHNTPFTRHLRHPVLTGALLRMLTFALVVTGLLALTLTFGQTAYAAGPFTVDTTSDTHCTGFVSQSAPGCTAVTDGSGHISLRSALELANTAGGATTINLPTGTYNLIV